MNLTLSEISQFKKMSIVVFPFVRYLQKSYHRYRKQDSDFSGAGDTGKWSYCWMDTEFQSQKITMFLEMDGDDGFTTI